MQTIKMLVEHADNNYWASPVWPNDLGIFVSGDSLDDVIRKTKEAIQFYIESEKECGNPAHPIFEQDWTISFDMSTN